MRSLSLTGLAGAPDSAPAVSTEADGLLSYGELAGLVRAATPLFDEPGSGKKLVLLRLTRDLAGLTAYLAGLELGHCLLLVEDAPAETVEGLIAAYRPDLVLGHAPESGYRTGTASLAGRAVPVGVRDDVRGLAPVHPETGLLLRTSGSLGTPKVVRLSYRAIAANATAIGAALRLTPADRGVTALPVDYSFGLSMVNSHLAVGASVELSARRPTAHAFWRRIAAAGVTEFGLVPTGYRLLRTQRWRAADHAHLRLLYQAGGALDPDTIRYFAGELAGIGAGFAVMYGQTEATARIACLDPSLTVAACGSVGKAIPGGRLWTEDPEEPGRAMPEGAVGEVVYEGPNVMQGYATGRADLADGDRCGGVLRTGDLGVLRDGLLYLHGRRDRTVKVLGRRISLDEVERAFAVPGIDVAVLQGAGADAVDVCHASVKCYANACDLLRERRRDVAAALCIPAAAMRLVCLENIPRTGSGKVDYARLATRVTGEQSGTSELTI
ncbi:AMP-binding protein [Rugosimonospora africana]|uniref:AMP-dependent acyl-CoA synthetase n=1 Tax=Rugosimonospora africana TaxID=556532 RepID=A0A8J3QLN7_9ACTN|nr:AMP-binding protein [Rugosimonospora africana]GIH11872.1 AMP-dependent acyl-CoA synthetase [Rugosimonospora africana]